MSKYSKGLFGGFVTLGLVSAGSAFGYRTRLVSKRREEISELQRDVDERIAQATHFTNAAEAAHAKAMSESDEMRVVVSTIWNDRRQRYDKTVRDMESYLVAAPESIGVLQGIIHHGRFLESVLPSFVRFDARAHQVQSLLLSLTAGQKYGLAQVAPDLLKLHSYDPFIRTLSDHAVTVIGQSDAPRSIKEVSDSFAYCHSTLERAIEEAQDRLVTERTVVPKAPSFPSEALGALLSHFRASLGASSVEGERVQNDEANKRHKADLRVLNTPADIRAAVLYTEQLTDRYRHLIEAASSSSPFADPQVKEAVKQFEIWKDSVLSFLLHQQAQRALHSYALCLVDPLTQQVREGIPDALLGQ